MHREISAISPRLLNHDRTIDSSSYELDRVGFDRGLHDDDVAQDSRRNLSCAERWKTDLDVHGGREALNPVGFSNQCFQLGANLLPLGIRDTRKFRLERAPAARSEMRTQASPQIRSLANVKGRTTAVAKNVDTWSRWSFGTNTLAYALPFCAAVFDDERLTHKPLRERGRSIVNSEHFLHETDVVRRVSHLGQAPQQTVPQQHASMLCLDRTTIPIMRSDVDHKQQAPRSVRCFVITVSDTRTEDTDKSGGAIADLLTAAGHDTVGRVIVKDEATLVRSTFEKQLASLDVDVIISTGGTGITSRDTTFEVVNSLLEKHLDGFGELFRMLSYQEIGSAAMMSRATAGLTAGHIVIALPGSEAAVRLAMEKLVLPELGHLAQQAKK